MSHPLPDYPPVAVVAHRGAAISHPENTIAAFEAAIAAGADSIEFDVRQTGDRVLVCIHDETPARTAGCPSDAGSPVRCAPVGQASASELTALDAGTWKHERFAGERIPTLARALTCMHPRTIPMIERKDGDAEVYVETLAELGLTESVLLQAFDWDWLREVRRLEPRIPLGALGGQEERPFVDEDRVRQMRELGVCFAHWRVDRVDPESVDRLRDAGLRTCVFTADDATEFERLVDAGVAMITTNDPVGLRTFLRG